MIYFVQVGKNGPVKIGFTMDFDRRIKLLRWAHPTSLRVLRTIEGTLQQERWLHKTFKKTRIGGEWFKFSPLMLTISLPKITRSRSKSSTATTLRRAVQIVGSEMELSRLTDVAQSTIWYWLNRSKRPLPAEVAIRIETATKGEVTRHELRPDVFGAKP